MVHMSRGNGAKKQQKRILCHPKRNISMEPFSTLSDFAFDIGSRNGLRRDFAYPICKQKGSALRESRGPNLLALTTKELILKVRRARRSREGSKNDN
ncbi:unnamed protein product [Caenorhabditis auriculariae]|uniref:Uncharacterized protein n=1 Tax=Caenorhabditis auriculariae TaxID=2777116 RepID=A0A8S1HQN9_9PELO|nr:unnamed protein product [Caenorhabditis auriculariae]